MVSVELVVDSGERTERGSWGDIDERAAKCGGYRARYLVLFAQ
jgi:hypothetical protein